MYEPDDGMHQDSYFVAVEYQQPRMIQKETAQIEEGNAQQEGVMACSQS